MRYLIKQKNIFLLIVSVAALLLAAAYLFVGCSDDVKPTKNVVTVTLLNGEHYTVSGDNKKVASGDGAVTFDVTLDNGYKIVGANGAYMGEKLHFTNDLSFNQTVTFKDVRYKTVARLETIPLTQYKFSVVANGADYGDIIIDTALGEAENNVYYENDIIDISARANDGHRFLCWSTENFVADGGNFYSAESTLSNFDFTAYNALYANFKDKANTQNVVYYRFENGLEIDQDCSALLAHHARANTLTAAEARAFGVDLDGRMLTGWKTERGEYVGLGSRVTVSKTNKNVLYPVWREYSEADLFAVTDNGKITDFHGDESIREIVIPHTIGTTTVTAIDANAFEGCAATTYYLPDTITTVENNAFLNCKNLTDLYMSDNISDIDDKAFTGCESFTTLHLNAVLKPRYFSYNSIKAELYDELILNADNGKQKLVLFGGSSVRHGYSEKTITEMFERSQIPLPQVYNMGLSVDAGVHCMFELAKPYLRNGDTVLHAPEIADRSWSGRLADNPLTGKKGYEVNYRIFEVAEPNWSLLCNLTVNKYCNIFNQIVKFNASRATMRERSYADYYKYVFDSEYGVRKNTEYVNKENGVDKSFGNDGKINFEVDLDENIKSACADIYKYLNDTSIKLYLTFPPVNKQTLLLTYQDEQAIESAGSGYKSHVESLLSAVDYTMLLTPFDTVYAGRHFSDSDYHLGDPFRNEHTEKVISALIDKLKQANGEVSA